jgi:hypothetical protein
MTITLKMSSIYFCLGLVVANNQPRLPRASVIIFGLLRSQKSKVRAVDLSSKRYAISWAIECFPVPAWPRRTSAHSDSRFSTYLVIYSSRRTFTCACKTTFIVESQAGMSLIFAPNFVLLVILTIRESCDYQNYPPASSTATSVVTAARERKIFRNRTRSARYCSIFPSTWPTIYFRAISERDKDDVPTCTSSPYD